MTVPFNHIAGSVTYVPSCLRYLTLSGAIRGTTCSTLKEGFRCFFSLEKNEADHSSISRSLKLTMGAIYVNCTNAMFI